MAHQLLARIVLRQELQFARLVTPDLLSKSQAAQVQQHWSPTTAFYLLPLQLSQTLPTAVAQLTGPYTSFANIDQTLSLPSTLRVHMKVRTH